MHRNPLNPEGCKWEYMGLLFFFTLMALDEVNQLHTVFDICLLIDTIDVIFYSLQ